MIRVINGLNLKSTTRRVICLYRMIADKFSLPGNSESVKELLHWAIFFTNLSHNFASTQVAQKNAQCKFPLK